MFASVTSRLSDHSCDARLDMHCCDSECGTRIADLQWRKVHAEKKLHLSSGRGVILHVQVTEAYGTITAKGHKVTERVGLSLALKMKHQVKVCSHDRVHVNYKMQCLWKLLQYNVMNKGNAAHNNAIFLLMSTMCAARVQACLCNSNAALEA